jgi:hypothetical protein
VILSSGIPIYFEVKPMVIGIQGSQIIYGSAFTNITVVRVFIQRAEDHLSLSTTRLIETKKTLGRENYNLNLDKGKPI